MKLKPISIFLFICVLMSCKSTNSPKAVTETFLVSVARLDISNAKNYSTKETWNFLKVLEKSTKDISQEQKEAYLENFKVNILKETKLNDSTYVVEFNTQPELLPFNKLNLVAEKNLEGNIKWKVDFNSFEYLQSDSTIENIMIPGNGIDPEEAAEAQTDTATIQNN